MKYNIAFDAQNNEGSLEFATIAAHKFAKENPKFNVWLIGNAHQIQKFMPANKPENLLVLNEIGIAIKKDALSKDVVKEENSMNTALKMLAEQQVDAVLSAGESSLLLASSMLMLKRLTGIKRPAFMPMIPTIEKEKYFLMLDVGANIEVKPEYLHQWAQIAKIFYQNLFKVKNPIIGLINIGTEDYKGFDFHKEANILLKLDKTLNYKGFVETKSILEGNIDIVLSDGYAGNLVLKTMEGTVLSFVKLLKSELKKTATRQFAALMLKPAFSNIKERFDYRNVGAAWIIGLNGIVLKAHSSSDEKAFEGALNQIKLALESQIFSKLKETLKE
ncbi:phosphate acyltransferase PlsX [Mycoplasma hyorhinis]|uniref:phosphate acyltransferase PlsX n=1 Tax=Mesomycoplasma hyorhinis TaxID=2100 RepID=UPI00136D45D8|nr:phosphate acyltransferase PlsX [Mesomycoplasma hyorhinis]MXR06537.1 phosphate acyltransferase PlsX [Mesomycoplasma hyorhinis]